jgi:rod shape-determining protein MreC
MFKLLQRYREPLFVGVLLVMPLVGFLSSGHRGRSVNLVDRLVLALASPLQGALTWALEGAGDGLSSYLALRGAREQAVALRAELAEVKAALNDLKEAQSENERLKAKLAYVETTVDTEVLARVIGLNPATQYQSVRINRGEADGVRVGMAVVSTDGQVGQVVGQVVRSVDRSADVMLLTDPSSRIGVVVQRTRVRGNVAGAGDGKRLTLEYVRREDDAKEEDVLVTSGTDGVFPRGLVLGTIKELTRPLGGMFLQGQVQPSVDLSTVEEVLVIPETMTLPHGLKAGGESK